MEALHEVLARAAAALRAGAPRIVETMARTGLALVVLRMQRDGLPGVKYSTNPIPTYWWEKRTLNAGGKQYLKDNKTGTWGAFRAAQGLPSDRVTLTYTGGMVRGLTVAAGATTGTVFTARVVAADAETALKLTYNRARYGDFLAPNLSEAADIRADGQAELDAIIKQVLSA